MNISAFLSMFTINLKYMISPLQRYLAVFFSLTVNSQHKQAEQTITQMSGVDRVPGVPRLCTKIHGVIFVKLKLDKPVHYFNPSKATNRPIPPLFLPTTKFFITQNPTSVHNHTNISNSSSESDHASRCLDSISELPTMINWDPAIAVRNNPEFASSTHACQSSDGPRKYSLVALQV